uniref:Phospholipase A2 n=1 Tax=Podarcis muralis TaxID=64176 RepID=A0A670HWL8_PODMU
MRFCFALGTSSDCYVSLRLPSASNKQMMTKIISNTGNPVWNESFHFFIQTEVKNVLELKLYDEDVVTKDDLIFMVAYDIAKVRPGETICEDLLLNRQVRIDTIYPLFMYLGPLSPKEPESFEEAQAITQESESFTFHCVKNWEPKLEASTKVTLCLPRTAFFSVPAGARLTNALKDHYREGGAFLSFYSSLGDLDVRLGCDLCGAEQDFLSKRKNVVASALKKVLLLEQELQRHEVPVIAVMATGGGARAMSAFYGHLSALQKLNLLDCVTYLSGASGATWTMRSLYEDADWSQKDLMGPIHRAQEYIARSKSSAFSLEALQHYDVELRQRAQEGHSVYFTDVWSLIIDRMFHDEQSDSKLSSQQQAVTQGQNPLPIYLALSVKKDTQSTCEFKEWCEFSPYEVGFSKYGAFICPEDFGSDFFMGRLINKRPESRICYLEGIWSNIFSLNLKDVHHLYKSWQWPFPDQEKDEDKGNRASINQLSLCHTACFIPSMNRSSIFNGILTSRPIGEKKPNFLRGLQLHKDYYQHKTFSMWQDSKLDQCPNSLTPQEKELFLVDAGYFINTSCPPLIRKERNVDVILSLDYNLLETRFNDIPFPEIALTEEDRENPKECYIFEDKENPEAPIILHFPLVNNSFREYKKPGIRRTSADTAKGEVDFTSLNSPYRMTNLTYTEEEFNKLINLSDYNIQNNRELILQALQTAVERRKASRKQKQLQST